MRLVAGVFALSVLSSLARAEVPAADARPADPAPPPMSASPPPTAGPIAPRAKIPLRLVRVLPESHQALLYDRERATHVLAEVGGSVEGYTVDAIDDDEVALSRDGKQIVLAGPMATPAAAPTAVPGAAAPAPPQGSPAPLDPYGEAADAVATPQVRVAEAPDAVSTPGQVRVAEAPQVRVAEAPAETHAAETHAAETHVAETHAAETHAAESSPAAQPLLSAPSAVTTAAPTPAAATPEPPVVSHAPAPAHASSASRTSAPAGPVVLSRGDLDAALADFGALGAQVSATFSPAGLVVERVGAGTIFERAGLRAGDVIASVDGTRLTSLDDAATLYARLSDAHALTAQLVRDGKPITLHLAIQ